MAWSGGTVEACGLVLRRDSLRVVRLPNRAPEPGRAFALDPRCILEASRGATLVGVWHSHPGGSCAPSAADHTAASLWAGTWWWIAAPPTLAVYRATPRGLLPSAAP